MASWADRDATAMVYAPVRFFLEYLRPGTTDPRYLSLTFAQWCSILAFAVAVYVASRLVRNGKPAETVARASREATDRLRLLDAKEVAQRPAP